MVMMLATIIAAGQDDVQTRSILSPDFAGKRAPNSKIAPKIRLEYKPVRSYNNPSRRVPSKKPAVPAAASSAKSTVENTVDIGMTMWKLRPPAENEAGFMFPVVDDKQKKSLWVAERVDSETSFTPGDKVRLAVEATFPGYLYIFDRETYSDGTLGEPYLIFPETLNEDNFLAPGMIVDIPDQREEMPYFNIKIRKPLYTGERLSVIISTRPLTKFAIDDEGKLIDEADLVQMEFESDAQLFSRNDKTDRIYTKSEAKSACGIVTRQLERTKTAGKPCGKAAETLTPNEPLPQSIFRIKTTPGKPALAFVTLRVKAK